MTSLFAFLLRRNPARAAGRPFPGSLHYFGPFAVAIAFLLAMPVVFAQSPAPITLVTRTPEALAAAIDSGPVPSSQRISLTLTMAPTPDRAAALDQFLSDVVTPKNTSFHKFVTPSQFAASFGPTSDQIASVSSWLAGNGLTVDAISPSGTRMDVSGPASAVQSALAVTLHNYQVSGGLYFANANQPSLPAVIAPEIKAIDGLSTIPLPSLTTQGKVASLSTLAETIDSNVSAILTLDSSLTSASLTTAQMSAYSALFRQASAQGITLLASRPPLAEAFPAALPEVTAITLLTGAADTSAPTFSRPSWQSAPGLPADSLRHTPDLTAASLTAFAQTLSNIETASDHPAGRQGNINRILYELGPTPGLYAQPDSSAAGTWEAATGLGLIDLHILAKVFPRGTTAVEVDTTSSSYNPVHGAGFILTTTVYPAASATPTGTITWTSSNGDFGAGKTISLNGNGVAVSPTFQLPGGTYTIVSTYSGDSVYASDSTSTTLTVTSEPANFTLTAPTTATLGGTLDITATLSSPSGVGIPSGTVTTTLTGADPQTQKLTAGSTSSTASFLFKVNQGGTLAVQSTCTSGDQSFTCYNQQTASINVAKATPTVSLSLSSATPTNGASVTFTSVVTGQAGITPTGTVSIVDNGTTIASITLPATTANAPLTAGRTSHTITAQYSGDGTYDAANSASVSATSGVAPTSVTVTAFPTSFPYGQTTTLVIAVAPTSGNQVNNTAPSGVVTVTSGSAVAVTTSALNNGGVNVTLTDLSVGTYPLKVSYAGDSNYGASSNSTATVTVTPFAATISPTLSYNMFTTGSTQTLTVQFASATNGPVPQNAAFTATLDGTAYTQTFSINGGGVNATGQVTIKAPPAGTYNLQVSCVANPAFTCNTPAPISVTSTSTTTTPPPGTGTGTSPTQTVLTSSSASPAAGAAVTLTATVSSTATPALTTAPTGTVTFYDGATALTSSSLTLTAGAYVATASVTLTGSSAHSLTAVYSGDTVFATSTSAAISITSNASPAAITLTASSATGAAGQAVTFTARVTGSTSSGVVPTGSVTFYLEGTVPAALGTVALGYSGPGVSVATLTTTGLPAGTAKIYAVYSGDGNFAAITSNTVTIGLSDYAVVFSPTALSLLAGQSGSATVSISAVGAYTGTVSLSCTPPINTSITCVFTPASVLGAGSSTLTVTTVAGDARSFQSSGFAPGNKAEAVAGVSLALLLSLLLPGRTRRRLVPTLLLLFLGLALTATIGCGTNPFNSTTPVSGAGNGTPLGTSILTINTSGTDGATTIHHDYSFQVTVQ